MLRHLTAGCLAALLALNLVTSPTSAKPPDLPDAEPIIVSDPAAWAGPSITHKWPGFGKLLPHEVRAFLAPTEGVMFICAEPVFQAPKIETACPFHPRTPAERQTIKDTEAATMPSVLDNLHKLEKAADEIALARKLGQAGKLTEALEHLDTARKLCPGSSMVKRADAVREELTATHTRTETLPEPTTEKTCCCCCPLAKATNCGMCWLARLCGFCDKVQETAVAQATPVVYPKRAGYLSSLSPEACLCQPISLHYDAAPLEAIVSDLGNVGILVAVDPVELKMRGLTSHLPITIHVEAMPLQMALDLICRPLGLGAHVSGEAICIGAPIFTGCGPGVSTNAPAEECEPTSGESVCPKCEKMHQQVMLKRKNRAGVDEQVNGLMKACYLAFSEGRRAKAADLAREAYALDPHRVEGDPLIYKLHLLAEKGASEECEQGTEPSELMLQPEDNSLSLRPELPPVDPNIVPALDAVLTGAEGKEEARAEYQVEVLPPQLERFMPWSDEMIPEPLRKLQIERHTQEVAPGPNAASCPCCKIVQQICTQALGLFLNSVPADTERGSLILGLSTTGSINITALEKVEGMKILVLYQSGIPLIWVQPAGEKTGVRPSGLTAP